MKDVTIPYNVSQNGHIALNGKVQILEFVVNTLSMSQTRGQIGAC